MEMRGRTGGMGRTEEREGRENRRTEREREIAKKNN